VSPLDAVADYAARSEIESAAAIEAARESLIEALAGGFESLRDPACAALLGPLVPGALMPGGARVPGTSLELDPPQAAFCLGVMLCRSSSADGELGQPYGCAAASLAALLAAADYRARKALMEGNAPPTLRSVLAGAVKALAIQRALAPAGQPLAGTAALDLARVAATAMITAQLGGTRAHIVSALGYALLDGGPMLEGGPLREGEKAPGTARIAFATAEAMSRATRHACQAMARRGRSDPTALEWEAADPRLGRLGAAFGTPLQPFGVEGVGLWGKARGQEETTRVTVRFQSAVDGYFPARQAERIKTLFGAPERLDDLPVNELFAALVTNGAR
jgi:2-methylcitrate dehydratase